MRGHRLAFATVIVLLIGWRAVAHAGLSVAPGTLATPATSMGVASGAATGTLSNTSNGNTRVDILVGTCSGAGNGAFTFTPANTVSFNSTIDISVTYTPSALGPRSCGVSVFNQGETTGALTTFTVTGDGQRPPTLVPGAIAAFPAVREFDNAVAPHTSTRNLTITNTGDRNLDITSVVTSGDFSIDASSMYGGGATTISGNNGNKTWVLRFDPTGVGTRNGTITFASNDPASPTRVVNLTGDGTSGVFSINAANSGDFNTVAAGTSATLDIAVTHSGGTPKGVLTFKTATITTASHPWFTITAQPNTLTGATTTGNVTIRCSPPALAVATATATVNVIADSDGSAGPGFDTTLTQGITCQGGASLLALSMSVVDFEPTLVGTTSTVRTVTVTNSGTSSANIQFTPTGMNATRFSAVGPGNCGGAGPCSIPMGGGTIDITVQFSPTAEGSVGASFQFTGGGPSVGFSVSGRGIDRHINLPEAVMFADTFRNPGSRATLSPVPVMNTGEYPIIVSGLQMGGDESVWSIDESMTPLPLTIEGLTSGNVWVRFAPNAAGKADDGQLLIVNDDTKVASGMPIVVLAGNGKNRNVEMNPGAVDVGETFAGVPTRLSVSRPDDMLTVINMEELADEGKNDFVIREIKVEGDDAAMFEVQNLDESSLDGHPIKAGQSLRVDVVFNPSHVGDFEATLVLYLDEDPQYVRLIPVRGRALFADANGSGGFGCSTGGGSHGGMVLLVVVLGLVLRRRRR